MSENILTQEVSTPAKPKTSKKKLWIILTSIVAVLAIAAAIFFSCFGQYSGPMYKNKEDVYAYFEEKPHSSLCYDISKYEGTLKKLEQEYLSEDESVAEDVKAAKPLPDKYIPLVEEGNQLLIDFFNETYGISVEAELAQLKVTCGDLPEGIVGVYYMAVMNITDGKTITLSNAAFSGYEDACSEGAGYLNSWKTEFYETYLHETIHYLGSVVPDDSIEWVAVTESVTQALTEDVLQYAGYDYENEFVYYLESHLAEQLLVVDKDVVVMLIDGFNYRSTDEIEAYFDSKSFDGMGDALNNAFALVWGQPKAKKYQRIAQHLMGEYLKHYDLTEEQMIEIADLFIAPISKIS